MAVVGTKEAARRLGVSVRRVQAMIKQRIVEAQKIGRDWVIDETEISRLSVEVRKPGRPPKSK